MGLLAGVDVACFDLFDTLVRIDVARLPTVEWEGNEVRSTLPILHERLFAPRGIALERLIEAVRGMWRRVREELSPEDAPAEEHWPEIPAVEKYRRLLRELAIGDEVEIEALAEEVAETHHGALVAAAVPIGGAPEVLARVHARGRHTALVSNWDHARAGPALLAQTGLAGLFDHVVISEAVGVRKPDRRIFAAALEPFGARPEAALHVGDMAKSDAWGAGRLGMKTVWINPGGEDYPEVEHPPTLTLARLEELLPRLG
jgi:HAD superfamily hydrolase (TIGR01509 family)